MPLVNANADCRGRHDQGRGVRREHRRLKEQNARPDKGGGEKKKEKRDMQLCINNNKKATINANVFFSGTKPQQDSGNNRGRRSGDGQPDEN